MKPAFALSFSTTGISLHHQSDDEWFCVGEIALDAPDLKAQIRALRDKGFALENDLSCKVVIPQDQVRFISASTNGLSPEEALQKAYASLVEATPYEIDELAFDTETVGPTTFVAAVARATLNEATEFTSEHGFIPVQFSTSIDGQDFPREPLFSLSAVNLPAIESTQNAEEVDTAEEPETVQPSEEAETAHTSEETETTHTSEEAETVQTAEEPEAAHTSEEAETVQTTEEPETNDAAPPAESSPTVHSIADITPPDVFRSAPDTGSAEKPEAAPAAVSKRYVVPAAAAALVLAVVMGAWALIGPDDADAPEPDTVSADDTQPASDPATEIAARVEPSEPEEPTPQVAITAPEEPPSKTAEVETEGATPQIAEEEPEAEAEVAETPQTPPSEEEQPELSATDSAILEALNVAPTVVEEIARDPEPVQIQPGIEITTPAQLEAPALIPSIEPYLASVDNSNLSSDAIALPSVQSFDTDEPFEQIALPGTPGTRFELDDRGLVTPTAEGTLNPDGVIVYLGQPSKVPPEPPVRFEQEPVDEDVIDPLAGQRPKPRPENLIEQFERRQLGGRTREELAVLRPKLRPESLQQQPEVDETPTALAVVRVPRPKSRPAGLATPPATQTANLGSTAAIDQTTAEAGSFTPKAVAPKIPSSASVARQATIDNALNLRKLNLIGVYGTPANRRALVRLPSGRYKKLKVGDRLDGGRVIAISDSELRYQKKGRNLTLKMPRS